jgi:hypothetical protein
MLLYRLCPARAASQPLVGRPRHELQCESAKLDTFTKVRFLL